MSREEGSEACSRGGNGEPTYTHLLCISPDAPTNPVLYWLGNFNAVSTRFLLEGAKGPLRLDLGDTLYAPNLMEDVQVGMLYRYFTTPIISCQKVACFLPPWVALQTVPSWPCAMADASCGSDIFLERDCGCNAGAAHLVGLVAGETEGGQLRLRWLPVPASGVVPLR